MGYIVEPGLFTAAEVGGTHKRERVFILACNISELGNPKYDGLFAREIPGGNGTPDGERGGEGGTVSAREFEGTGELENAEWVGRRGGCDGDAGRGRWALQTKRPRSQLANPEGGDWGLQLQQGRQKQSNAKSPGTGEAMADTSKQGLSGGQQRRTPDKRDGSEASGSVAEFCLPLFPPGPSDPRWAGIVEQYPHLAPAIHPPLAVGVVETELRRSLRGIVPGINRRQRRKNATRAAARLARIAFKENSQPSVLELADELAQILEYRAHALRLSGNGVVPIQAAFAFVSLVRKLAEQLHP